MSKRATTFERALPAKASPTPAYRWPYSALRAAILGGRLHPGARLPATRDLAAQYRLSRGTIVNAVEQLKSEGYVQARMGPGTYVSETLPDELLQVRSIAKPKQPQQQPRTQPRKISAYPKRVHLFPAFAPRPSRAFRPNLPALDLFPPAVGTGRRGRLRKVSTNFLLGCDPRG
jgi:GntR family transcriptional regulator/MocR family aminotransferase